MDKLKPIRCLGQNFLVDNNIVKKIVSRVIETGNDNNFNNKKVIEIGPGMGALTKYLLDYGADLTCYDLDLRSVEYLKEKFSTYKNFNVIHSDILKISLKETKDTYSIIGNIPYNITNDIIFWLVENRCNIDKAILTMQSEVADRLTAKVKTKLYGTTSVILKLFCDVKVLFKITPAAFYPPPKVTSAVVALLFENKSLYSNINKEKLCELIRSSFSQRRKKLSNSLRTYFLLHEINQAKLNDTLISEGKNYMNCRAEELTIEQYIDFFEYIWI